MKIYIPGQVDDTIAFFLEDYSESTHNISDCELIIHPTLLRTPANIHSELRRISRHYKSSAKKVLLFILDDFEGDYPFYNNLVICRTSLHDSKRKTNEWLMPYLWETSKCNSAFTPGPASSIPTIGFCGLTTPLRSKIIEEFKSSNRIVSNFIIRDQFWGGKPQDPQLMAEFWENLRENNFALTPRGAGNFSMRFYQALSVGRIPVLVDTDMALPFSNIIPWKDIIVFEKTAESCLQRVIEIHGKGQVSEKQQRCYEIFHRYLSHKVFLNQLLTQLSKTIPVEKPSCFQKAKKLFRIG